MLVVSIVALVLEYVFYIICAGLVVDPEHALTGCWIMFILIAACTVISIATMVSGITGIKRKSSRGRSIATTAVSAVGLLSGLILVLCVLYLILILKNPTY